MFFFFLKTPDFFFFLELFSVLSREKQKLGEALLSDLVVNQKHKRRRGVRERNWFQLVEVETHHPEAGTTVTISDLCDPSDASEAVHLPFRLALDRSKFSDPSHLCFIFCKNFKRQKYTHYI